MAIIVIDMLRGFLEKGYPLFCGTDSRKIILPIRNLLEKRIEKEKVIFLRDEHREDDPEFRVFPKHCLEGSIESQVVPELQEFWKKGIDVPKTRFSGFFGTNLDEILRKNTADDESITAVGVCTDICVMYTVADLRSRDYDVIVPADCVASFDKKAHKFALDHMEKILGAKVI
ncbi:MAG: cysteine hydrolase [Candidatus Schekmanbacteria bacterium]|nr:MAG: cysteine hydrolase [Candidatus Schekmanbacteria bacterium]